VRMTAYDSEIWWNIKCDLILHDCLMRGNFHSINSFLPHVYVVINCHTWEFFTYGTERKVLFGNRLTNYWQRGKFKIKFYIEGESRWLMKTIPFCFISKDFVKKHTNKKLNFTLKRFSIQITSKLYQTRCGSCLKLLRCIFGT
jgi:hypothetical protein